jgi:hypothetical protein
MRATSEASAAVRALVAALPDACLRDLCIQLALNRLTPPPATSPIEPSARRKGGWPRGRPRGSAAKRRQRGTEGSTKGSVDPKLATRRKRYEAKRAAARQAAKATEAAANGSNGQDAAVTPQAFWQHAEKLEPTRPWRAVVREFDVKEALAQNCYRKLSLPPHVGPMAVTKFLMLQPA